MKKVTKGALADTRIGMLDAADTLRTRDDYASAISRLWDRAAESYVQIGRHLTQAKERLAHGEFEAMIESDLPFSPSVGRRLRAAAQLVDSGALPRDALPNAWSVVAELATLTPDEQQQALTNGVIHPDMRRTDVLEFKRQVRTPEVVPPPIPDLDRGPPLPFPELALPAMVPDQPGPTLVSLLTSTPEPVEALPAMGEKLASTVPLVPFAVEDIEGEPVTVPDVQGEPPPPTTAELLAQPWYVDKDAPGVVLADEDGMTVLVIDPHHDTGLDDATVATLAEHIVNLHNAALRAGPYSLP
ncbi:hypothetical protein [Azospirillum sp. sgz302134]